MRRFLSALFVFTVLVLPAAADSQRVAQLLRLKEVVEVMRDEGLAFGAELGRDMLPVGQVIAWGSLVQRLYDVPRMNAVVTSEFSTAMPDEHCANVEAFFDTPLGEKIVAGEIRARRAFLDAAVELAAHEALIDPSPEQQARMDAVDAYMLQNQLVEYNVAGGLTANFKFFQGMVEGGMMDLSEDEMLAEAWATEDDLRRETRDWLMAYLMQSYRDLTIEEITEYTRFSASTAGQALNRAVFAGFDRMYSDLSLALGLAMADLSRSEEL